MLSPDIYNIIQNYIRLSEKKLTTIEKKLLNTIKWIVLRHYEYNYYRVIGIFTTFKKAKRYTIRNTILTLNCIDIDKIKKIINDNYIIKYIDKDIDIFYLSDFITIYNISHIEDLLINYKINMIDEPIPIDPIN